MGAQKYTPMIRRYCSQEGIEVPAAFDRHPANPLAVVRLDSSPARLSTATFFKKADLHYYIRSKVRELGVGSPVELPLRVLDFKAQVELVITETGTTRPGQPLALSE